jgi:hypothetical protein
MLKLTSRYVKVSVLTGRSCYSSKRITEALIGSRAL